MTRAVALTILALCSLAARGEGTSVESLRPLLVTALQARDGRAQGYLVGRDVQRIGAYFRTESPIVVDVTTLKRYRQAGCSRLRVDFRQRGVVLPGETKPQDKYVGFGLNYCLDGNPPKSLE